MSYVPLTDGNFSREEHQVALAGLEPAILSAWDFKITLLSSNIPCVYQFHHRAIHQQQPLTPHLSGAKQSVNFPSNTNTSSCGRTLCVKSTAVSLYCDATELPYSISTGKSSLPIVLSASFNILASLPAVNLWLTSLAVHTCSKQVTSSRFVPPQSMKFFWTRPTSVI